MPYIKVNISKIRNYSTELSSVHSKVLQIQSDFLSLSDTLDWDVQSASDIKKRATSIGSELSSNIHLLDKMTGFLLSAVQNYGNAEDVVSQKDSSIAFTGTLATSVLAQYQVQTDSVDAGEPTEENSSGNAYWDWLGYGKNDNGNEVSAWLGKGHASGSEGIAFGEIDACIGKATAGWDFSFKFFDFENEHTKKNKDSEWEESEDIEIVSIDAEVGASVSVIDAEGRAGLGNNALGIDLEGSGSIGSAKAEGKIDFGIGTEDGNLAVDLNVGGEAMVSAVEGEVGFSFNFLGFDFGIKAGGYAGAAGVKGKVGLDDGKFVLEGGVAALLGFSLGLEIGFNPDGFYDAVEWVENAWEDTTEWVENAWEDTTEWVENAWEDTTEWVENAWEDTTEWVENAWEDTTEWVENAWEDTTEWVENAWEDTTNWFENAANDVVSFFSSW